MSEDRISRRTFLKGLGTSALAFGFSTFLRRQSAFAQDPSINFLTIQDPFFFSYEELLSEFEEETGIQVKLQGRSTDEIHAELVNSFVAEQKGLDVVGIDQMWLSQYAENKWIIPLDEYIKDDNDEFKPEELVPEVIHSMNEWRGSIYSIPSCAYTMLSFYRKDLFEEAGLTPPPEQQEDWWTWDTHLEYVRELDKLEDVDGTVIVGASPVPIVHMYSQLQASKGARWFEQFPESPWDFTPTINSAENREALEAYKELYDHSPAESISYVWFDAGTAFSTQDIGLYYWWTSYAYLMRRAGYMSDEKSPNFGKIDYGVIPHQPEVDQLTSIGGFSFGIPRYSQSKNEAWEFIKWASSTETQKKMAVTEPQLFSDFYREPLYEDEELEELYPWLPVQREAFAKGNGKLVRPPIPIYTTLEGFYGSELNKVLAGNKSPEKALEDTQKNFETTLKQNFYIPDYSGEDYNDTLENTEKLLQDLAS